MSERWRCFVAVPIDDDLRRSLGAAVAAWRDDPRTDGLRWVPEEAFHLTLAFLGPVESAAVPRISGAIGGVAARHAQ